MDGINFNSLPETSVFHWRNGTLWLTLRGVTFPKEGGVQSGHTYQEINVSDHIKTLIREVLAETAAAGQSPRDSNEH